MIVVFARRIKLIQSAIDSIEAGFSQCRFWVVPEMLVISLRTAGTFLPDLSILFVPEPQS